MDLIAIATQAAETIQAADREAQEAQLAYVLGDFPSLFERKAAAARERLEESYRELTKRADAVRGVTGEVS
jgi:hypothetical protein